MKLFLFAMLMSLAMFTSAGEVYLGGNSVHMKSAHATNQKHDFLALEYDNFVAGTFINSYGDRTKLLGYKLHIDDFSSQYWQVSVVPALTYGYRACLGGEQVGPKIVCPAMPLEIQYTKYPIVPTILVMPQAVVLLFSVKF